MANSFFSTADDPTVENNAKAVGTVSDIATGRARNVLKENGRIAQTERLFSARARYASTEATYTSDNVDLAGSRGERAYIKLLTSKKQEQEYFSGNTSRDLTYKELIARGNDGIANVMARSGGLSEIGYDEFLLTGVSCDMNEKVQISEVFGDSEVVYYFGRQPLIFNLRGVLIDSIDNDWFTNWVKVYSDFMRGSQLAKNYELLKIVLPNMIITGSIAGFSYTQDSSRDTDIAFSMQFIAKLVEPRAIKSTQSAINSPYLKGVDFSAAADLISTRQINSLKGQVASLSGVISNPN